MRNIWVISDTHFGHENIIHYCDRPFLTENWDEEKKRYRGDVEAMDEKIIENWNATVKPSDIIYHLGDVYMGKTRGFLERLAGRKRLILGNHDIGKDPYLIAHFEKIMMWRQFPEFGLLLTHVPVHPGSLSEKWPRNIHGHIHNRQILIPPDHQRDKRYINVSVEEVNYTPINIEVLRIKK